MERYEHAKRLKAYIVEVRNTKRSTNCCFTNAPGLVEALFRLEVPEIEQNVVEIKAIAREPGRRTKIAVWSNDDNVDPVGSCVGASGGRVREVMTELRGEKVDIVPFSEDPLAYVRAALSPAKNKRCNLRL
jgi:N utilization substance protein A